MSENIILCPTCGTKIDLDDVARHRYEEELKKNEARLKADFERDKEELRKKAVEWADKKAEERMKEKELETKDLLNQLEELKKKEGESMKNELELRKRTRELEERAKTIELENNRRLDEERKKLQESLTAEAAKREEARSIELAKLEEDRLIKIQEDNRKLLAEKEKQMEILRKSLEEANRKANQGSQQIQWEIQENELRSILSEAFFADLIEDVPTGIRGADLIHTVRDSFGRSVGIMLWESKNTKAFSQEWVKKLKDDRVIAKADICIIVTAVMPEGMKHFGHMDGVWITEASYAMAIATLLRDKLIALSAQERGLAGREEKMDILYRYLSSAEFKSKIENIIEAFKSMKDALDSEKRSMQRIWNQREKELERIIGNTAMLYGDMQGIMGHSLQTISYLELWSGAEDTTSESENKE